MLVATAIQDALRHTRVQSVGTMEGAEGREALRALNGAVQTWYALAPRIYRRKSITHRIPAPRTLNLSVTQYSQTVGLAGSDDDPFTTQEKWQSVLIDDEAYLWPNRITGLSSVMHDVRAVTDASTAATIYYDAIVFSDFTVERLVGEPLILDDNRLITRMSRADGSFASERRRWGDSYSRADTIRVFRTRPTIYDLEPFGHSRVEAANDCHFGLRMFPLPTAESTVELTVDLMPRRYTLTDLQSDTLHLPVPEEQAELTLMPLLEYAMARSTLFTGSRDTLGLLRDADQEAKVHLRILPSDWASSNLQIGTQRGF